jgi:hypothetical protein
MERFASLEISMRFRIAAALAAGALLPLPALAQSVVTTGTPVVVAPAVVVQTPVPSVTPVAPAYPSYPVTTTPAYSTYILPDGTTVIDRTRVVDQALPPPAPLTQEDYLREAARRWDASDIDHLGLTPAEMSALTGHVDSNALAPIDGTGVQPGNMGPGNSRGQ